MRVYLSGAITGVPNLNWEQFKNAERELISKGYTVINPLRLDHSNCKKYIDYMSVDYKALLTCDTIYMLKGYKFSRGAKLELRIALKNGLRVEREVLWNIK